MAEPGTPVAPCARPDRRLRLGAPVVRSLVLMAQVLIFASGCVSHYSFQPHASVQVPASLPDHCRYSFSVSVLRRTMTGFGATPWDRDAGDYHSNVSMQELMDACPPGDTPRIDGHIAAYYLIYSTRTSRWLAWLTGMYLFSTTLGLMPQPDGFHYITCLELTAVDGLQRKGIASGTFKVFDNVWGSGDTRFHKGETRRVERQDEAWQMLTEQAWYRAWTGPSGPAFFGRGCQADLDDILK